MPIKCLKKNLEIVYLYLERLLHFVMKTRTSLTSCYYNKTTVLEAVCVSYLLCFQYMDREVDSETGWSRKGTFPCFSNSLPSPVLNGAFFMCSQMCNVICIASTDTQLANVIQIGAFLVICRGLSPLNTIPNDFFWRICLDFFSQMLWKSENIFVTFSFDPKCICNK